MTNDPYAPHFPPEVCASLLPPSTADDFFEALFGDAEEGAYDIVLRYGGIEDTELRFDILLRERPGHCLSCSLTYGLPEVFGRHPVIDIEGLVSRIDSLLGNTDGTAGWRLGRTRQLSRTEHAIPLMIELQTR